MFLSQIGGAAQMTSGTHQPAVPLDLDAQQLGALLRARPPTPQNHRKFNHPISKHLKNKPQNKKQLGFVFWRKHSAVNESSMWTNK